MYTETFDLKFTNEKNKEITLRDYFANSASMVIPIEKERGFQKPTKEDYDTWASKCYKRADAMLKQREL